MAERVALETLRLVRDAYVAELRRLGRDTWANRFADAFRNNNDLDGNIATFLTAIGEIETWLGDNPRRHAQWSQMLTEMDRVMSEAGYDTVRERHIIDTADGRVKIGWRHMRAMFGMMVLRDRLGG
jgi:hypothetical protein